MARLQRWYQELRDPAQRSRFGAPIQIQSEEHNDQLTAKMHAIINHPFDVVARALAAPFSWCEFLPLDVNVKACTYQGEGHESRLTLYLGRKVYQSPAEAFAQPYQFAVRRTDEGILTVTLSALNGLYGITAHRLELVAAGIRGRTVLALRTSYVQSAASKLATAIYLATAGRDKVGFTRTDAGPGGPPQYVQGLRGMVERNIMRYYLAFEALLDTQAVPDSLRFEARITRASELMERYPLQLHDLDKSEYLEAKRKEWENQRRLQQQLDAAAAPPAR